MGAFSPDWLALREPADVAARSPRLTGLLSEVLRRQSVIRALDLGTGTGGNVRYLAERLPVPQEWLLVDDDPVLIAEAARRCPRGVARRVDLVTEIDVTAPDIFAGRSLVTASALLDLVSARWLRALAARCRHAGAAVLFALTYDGTIRCVPEEAEDETIRALVNQHQRSEKGFGPALGPTAADVAERCFVDLGYHVERDPSPWVLTLDASELQRQLIEGWAEAASEVASERLTLIERWRTRRLEHVAMDRSRLTVGHVDLAAWLPRSG